MGTKQMRLISDSFNKWNQNFLLGHFICAAFSRDLAAGRRPSVSKDLVNKAAGGVEDGQLMDVSIPT